VFHRGDNVLEYWVDHAEGFEVRSGARFRARVEAVIVDPPRGRAQALVVRSARLHRRQVIPVEAVVAVYPFGRRFEVEQARPPRLAPASRFIARLVVSVVTGIARLLAWSAFRLPQVAIFAYRTALRLGRRLAAAAAWLAPRARKTGIAVWALVSVLALAFGAALAKSARSIVAWSGPRLSAGARSAWTHATSCAGRLASHAGTAAVRLGPRFSSLARRASLEAVAVAYLCLIGVAAAVAWVAPRLLASARVAAAATLALGVAAAGAVHLLGRRLSDHVRDVGSLLRG
jgi:hypothetical protein